MREQLNNSHKRRMNLTGSIKHGGTEAKIEATPDDIEAVGKAAGHIIKSIPQREQFADAHPDWQFEKAEDDPAKMKTFPINYKTRPHDVLSKGNQTNQQLIAAIHKGQGFKKDNSEHAPWVKD